MVLDREDRMLVEALRAHAKGVRPAFPFDDLKFTLEEAAKLITALESRQTKETV